MATYRKSPETTEQDEYRAKPGDRGEWMVDVATHRVFRLHRLPAHAQDGSEDGGNEGGPQ